MRLTRIALLLLLEFGGGVFAYEDSKSFDGQIMDRQCALMHSHKDMMKAESATNEKDCTLACVKNGDKFALLDSTNAVYSIDDDKKARELCRPTCACDRLA